MKDIVNQDTGLPRLEWRDFPCSKKHKYRFIFEDFLQYGTTQWKNTVYRDYVVTCCADYHEIEAYMNHRYILSISPTSLNNAWRDYSRKDKPTDFDFTKRYVMDVSFKRTLKNRMRFTNIKVIDIKEDVDKFKKALIKQIVSERLEDS